MAAMEVAATFKISLVCAGCRARSFVNLAIPVGDDAPTSVGELEECGALDRVPFSCQRCEGLIGTISNVRQTYDRSGMEA